MTLQHMSLDTFLHLAQTMPRLAIYSEIMADRLTPIGVVERLAIEMEAGTLLESGLQQSEDGRYSYIAFGLLAQLSAYGHQVTQRIGQHSTTITADPFVVLRQMVGEYLGVYPTHELLRYHGAVGYVAYDAVRIHEAISDRHSHDQAMPDVLFHFYHTSLIFDHAQHKLLLAKIVDVDSGDHLQVYQDTQKYLQDLIHKVTQPSPEQTIVSKTTIVGDTEVDVSDAQFIQAIMQAKHHISQGDAFQIVLSRCFKKQYTASHLDIYRALRQLSPAPYMFYFPLDASTVMVGASPEKLITVRHGEVEINPIAGTRARLSLADEAKNGQELLTDAKEIAEHMMLVDLARNDLGAVCDPGSVIVKTLLQVRHFSHVSHLVSVVVGRLQANKDALDALRSTFPAGTVSGAPKIRAMDLIDTLEMSRRGLYGGALCRLDAEGNFDSCIAIRMAILRDGIATIRTGAGIVAESDPEAEAQETRHKAHGMLAAIALAEEGLKC